jgi:zinc transport system substrate-binding protein
VLVAIALAGATACGDKPAATPADQGSDRPTVFVVNYPLEFFANRIGGTVLDVVFPAIAGDPAMWEPTAEQVSRFQSADMILLNGAGYAAWASKVSLPSARMVDTGKSISDSFIPLNDAVTHSHGPGGEHEHGGLAFTIWLDPELAIEQAGAILDAFVRRWPGHS